jgi:hypothetical protein
VPHNFDSVLQTQDSLKWTFQFLLDNCLDSSYVTTVFRASVTNDDSP